MTVTTADEPAERHVDPLGPGWITVATTIGIMGALIALGGMVLSFRAVSTEMIPAFGARWSWLVPIVVDLTVFVFSGVDLVLARLDMSHPLARLTVYGATAGTVYLNYNATGALPGRIAHVLMPSIWVVFIELMRHVVRRQTNLATGSRREPIPASRWLVSPWPTLKLWRRMILWRQHSYPRALTMERQRLGAIAAARAAHGRGWRWRVGPLLRLQIALAEVGPADVVAPVAPAAEPDTDDDTEQDADDDLTTVASAVLIRPRMSAPSRTPRTTASRTLRRPNRGAADATTAVLERPAEQDTPPDSEQDKSAPKKERPAARQPRPLPDRARDLRARHPDWSPRQIADRLGVTTRTVSRYLNAPAKDGATDA
jgi:hypothetical protein